MILGIFRACWLVRLRTVIMAFSLVGLAGAPVHASITDTVAGVFKAGLDAVGEVGERVMSGAAKVVKDQIDAQRRRSNCNNVGHMRLAVAAAEKEGTNIATYSKTHCPYDSNGTHNSERGALSGVIYGKEAAVCQEHNYRYSGDFQESVYDTKRKIESCENWDKQEAAIAQASIDAAQQAATQAGKMATDYIEAAARKKELDEAAARDAYKAGEWLDKLFANLKDPEKIKPIAYAAVGIVAGSIVSYYGTKLTYEYIKMHMGKPTLITSTNMVGPWEKAKKSAYNYWHKPKPESLEDVVVPANLQGEIDLIAKSVKQSRELGLPYMNMMLYGPPGTGKTAFIKLLAETSGMDYACMSGADFAKFKDGEAVVEFEKVMKWAKNSKRGLLLFIDEAETCLKDRALITNRDDEKLLNKLLEVSGAPSSEIMFCFATNRPKVIDKAVHSRVGKTLQFDLPDAHARAAIVSKKLEKYCTGFKHTLKRPGRKPLVVTLDIDPELTKNMGQIAAKTEGDSGRTLEQMVLTARDHVLLDSDLHQCNDASVTKNLTLRHMENAIASRHEQNRRLAAVAA